MDQDDSPQPLLVPLLAVALVIFGLTIGPVLLLRPEVEGMRLGGLRTQLYAAFLYWTLGAALMIGPIWAIMTLPGAWFENAWTAVVRRVMAIPDTAFAVGVGAVAVLAAAFLAEFSFDRKTTTADGVAQLWHAKVLLSGRLALPADPNPEFFAIDNVIDRPEWLSHFPVGGPAVLAIGVLIGATWLLNPVFTGIVAVNMYRFVRRIYGEEHARAASLVIVTSPMVLLMGGSHMNHVPTMALLSFALVALPEWVDARPYASLARPALVIGAAIGAMVMIRPLDGAMAAFAIGGFMLASGMRQDRARRIRSLMVAGVAGAIPIALLLLSNWRTTGDALRFGYELLWGANHSIGLHDDPVGHPHTAARALHLAAKYLVQVNWVATAWPVPLLLITATGLLFARRINRWDAFLLAAFWLQLIGYAFYWHDGQFIGPRFLFSAVPGLLVLTARAPFLVAERIGQRGTWMRIAIVTVPACIVASWIAPMPPFGAQALAMEFRDIRGSFKVEAPPEARAGTLKNALVFVQEGVGSRVVHRLWGLGVSRPDAARFFEYADGCSLLEAVRAEEARPIADSAGRIRRIATSVKPFVASAANVEVLDINFRVTDSTSLTPACVAEVEHDRRLKRTIAYGPMLLHNRIDAEGRVSGDAVYVLDLGERNEALRPRFGARRWYRYEVSRGARDSLPRLVPYDSAR